MNYSTGEPFSLCVAEVAKKLGISKNLTYQLIRQGQIPAIRLGQRRLVIPAEAFETWLHEKLKTENPKF